MTPTLPDAAAPAPLACAHTAGVINSAAKTGTTARIFILTPHSNVLRLF
jgi:hypothetical protein